MMKNHLIYPASELNLKKQINQLNDDWLSFLKTELTEESFNADQIFVRDGFYPHYTSQKRKILFIGREALELGGYNYIDVLYEAYQEEQIGQLPLNRSKFHSTMLYLSYAMEHGIYDWDCIPSATDFISEFAQPNGISNAFMNLSKFSNERENGGWSANRPQIQMFLEISRRAKVNFFAEEIDLLSPDIIIGMNLKGGMDYLGTFEPESPKMYGGNDVCFKYLRTPSGRYPYLDCWHFSALKKSPKTNIFNPIIEALSDNLLI